MGATKSTQNIQMRILTGDGLTGFWSYRRGNSGDEIKDMRYNGKDAIVRTADKLDWAETFYGAIDDQKNSPLPATDQKTNVNTGPADHFQDPLMTSDNVDDIAGWFDPEEFCCKLGALLMVRRFFNNGHLNWSGNYGDADDIYIYLGQKRKAEESEVLSELDLLLYEQSITQQQYNDFWIKWNNEVQ